LIVPGMSTDSLPLSSAAFHKALLLPHAFSSSNVTYTLHLPREYDAKFPTVTRVELRGPQSSIISASIHLPLSTIYYTTMPPRWKSDARRRPPRFAYIRSCLPLLVLLILFSFLLSSVALLSHFRSPAAKQQLGWQAWDVVEMHYAKPDDEDTAVFAPSIPLEYWVS
jgi:hypothetical protein